MAVDLPKAAFTVERIIRFSDCDPAGIVFYAAYFRMFNDVFDDWFRDRLKLDWSHEFLVEQRMFPLVHIDADFKRARKMGDTIHFTLVPTAIGNSSIRYTIVGHEADEEYLRANCVTVVASKQSMMTIPIPDYLRERMMRDLSAAAGWRG